MSFEIPIQQLKYITLYDTIFIMAASMILTVLRCSFIIMHLIVCFLKLMQVFNKEKERERQRQIEEERHQLEKAQRQHDLDETLSVAMHCKTDHSTIEGSPNQSLRVNTPKTDKKNEKRLREETSSTTMHCKKLCSATEKSPNHAIRYSGLDHQKETTRKRTRCKLEGCRLQSFIICSRCKVYLCAGVGERLFRKLSHHTK